MQININEGGSNELCLYKYNKKWIFSVNIVKLFVNKNVNYLSYHAVNEVQILNY